MVSLEQEGPVLSALTQAEWSCGAIAAGMHPIIWMAIGVMICTETAERDVTSNVISGIRKGGHHDNEKMDDLCITVGACLWYVGVCKYSCWRFGSRAGRISG